MAKEVMRRIASDNKYFHQDFHGALSTAIDYLDRCYGEEAVREYLRCFTASYYAPLKRAIIERGLVALEEHFRKIYQLEGGKIEVTFSEDEMVIKIEACPAVAYMRKQGYSVARLFYETAKRVNETLCENTPFSAELLEYDPETGRSVIRFWRYQT